MRTELSPALVDAISRGDVGAVLRQARLDAGLSQVELGARFGCAASTISRFECGSRPLRDVIVLRRFAEILCLPDEAFGLNSTRPGRAASRRRAPVASMVGVPYSEEDDPVRRRTFLVAAGLAGTGLAAGSPAVAGTEPDPAALLTARLEDVLLGVPATNVAPTQVAKLDTALGLATADFKAVRYLPLASRLPMLIEAAETTYAENPAAARTLAEAYVLVTRALCKVSAAGLERISADRGLRVAHATGDPLVIAEAQRMVGSVCRRASQHERAQKLTIEAAQRLVADTSPSPDALALYGSLLCTAGYTAARAGNRADSDDLLGEARSTVARLAEHPSKQCALSSNVISHQVSASYVLGDTGTALGHARSARLTEFPDLERQGRFLVDVALAFDQGGKPDLAYRMLLDAERRAPGEIRTRATARGLITNLLHQANSAALPGLRDLARRTHVPT